MARCSTNSAQLQKPWMRASVLSMMSANEKNDRSVRFGSFPTRTDRNLEQRRKDGTRQDQSETKREMRQRKRTESGNLARHLQLELVLVQDFLVLRLQARATRTRLPRAFPRD